MEYPATGYAGNPMLDQSPAWGHDTPQKLTAGAGVAWGKFRRDARFGKELRRELETIEKWRKSQHYQPIAKLL